MRLEVRTYWPVPHLSIDMPTRREKSIEATIALKRGNSYDARLSIQNRAAPSMIQTQPAIRSSVTAHDRSLYGLDFWLAYVANLLVVTGNTLIFRFSEYVVS